MKFKKYINESVLEERRLSVYEQEQLEGELDQLEYEANHTQSTPERKAEIEERADEIEKLFADQRKYAAKNTAKEGEKEDRKTRRQLAAPWRQKLWQDELEAIGLELYNGATPERQAELLKREAELHAKFAKQRELEKRLGITFGESFGEPGTKCKDCGTLLNDGGTCPKCDDGEEDYGDNDPEDLDEGYEIRKFGSDWFAVVCPDRTFAKDGDKLKLFKSNEEAEKYIVSRDEEVLKEELSVKEKLKAAYPELDFDTPIVEECNEVLTNSQKLKAVYPELNIDVEVEPLMEGAGADTLNILKDAFATIAKDDKREWADTASKIAAEIPDNFADEVLDEIEKKCKNVRLSHTAKKDIEDGLGKELNDDTDTVGDVLDLLDPRDEMENNPELTKSAVIVLLKVLGALEPTPVVEVLTKIVAILPSNLVTKIAVLLQSTNPVIKSVNLLKKLRGEDITTVEESYDDYDDDYDFDDVEEDRAHAALYGGDRMYCDCGAKLKYDDDGYSYCPECDREDD